MVQGGIKDNPTLPEGYVKEQIVKYGATSRGRQELFGDLITDTAGAFWTHDQIDLLRAPCPTPWDAVTIRNQDLTNDHFMGRLPIARNDDIAGAYLIRIVIGFDPSGSAVGDECGIVVAALYSDKHAYVLEDASGSYNPPEYINKIAELYTTYNASAVVVESNYGGKETFLYMLRSVNATMNVKTVHAHTGKTTRAEHISALYNQGRVHHTGQFTLLEDQMCGFNPDYSGSPDRLDALGYCLTELFWPSNHSGAQLSFKNLPSR
jgi:phage terminase large subunit-like protein